MKTVKIFFYNFLSEDSFLSKKLKLRDSKEIILGKQYKLITSSDFKFNKPDLDIKIETINGSIPDSKLLQSNSASAAEDTVTIHFSGTYVASGLESIQSWRSEFLRFLEMKDTCGSWLITSFGFKSLLPSSGEFKKTITHIFDLNYFENKINFDIFASSPRHFNRLDFTEASVTKTSVWKKKALSEIFFLKNIPPDVQEYFLRIESTSESENTISYTTRTAPLFDFARLCIQNSLNDSDWVNFYEALNRYFEKLPRKKIDISRYKLEMKSLFIDKLTERCSLFKRDSGYESYSQNFKNVTGKDFEDQLQILCAELDREINDSTESELIFSHGDLCFSNILYDLETREIILVDPRGGEKTEEFFLPKAYDMAKLSQCALGHYDFTIFNRSIDSHRNRQLSTHFIKFAESKISIRLLRLCEASLFWSLLPLHQDSPQNIISFMKQGQIALDTGIST